MPMRNILVVDDDDADQFICEYTIRKYDPSIETTAAFNGREALEILSRKTPDAIILDINMPIMNGFEFLDRYAADFDHHVPVVAMLTSSLLDQDRKRAAEYYFVRNYFEKPLTMEHLDLMRKVLEG
ncbi:response regulator [Hoeflea olei]|uniref:Response regulatory domain-containing protein n=1 Tax=Hoeflea olei TaxID=1480615 RepID=A0A1C1YQV2_9HYPH|nr:response regulator [Hoeflea olei]OCW55750.1 hypothetical protein AWJ14_14790 [Hoeflea olei]